jgi:leucyl aminopeptidase
MEVKVKQGRIEKEAADVLVLTHYEKDGGLQPAAARVDKALGGWLRELLKSGEFTGTANQTALVHTRGRMPARRVLLVGLGKKDETRLDSLRQAMATAAKRARQVGAKTWATPGPGHALPRTPVSEQVQAMIEGAVLGGYQFAVYKRNNADEPAAPRALTLVEENGASLSDVREGLRRGRVMAEAAWFVRDLCNHPANVMTPSRVAEEARKLGRQAGVKVKVLERREIEKLGMGALLSVAQGSHEPPKFIILEHKGGGRNRRPTVLVGKTITFDSGGISLKPSENMEQMKADMTGGAEVLATVCAAARLKLPLHVIGLLPATENMPGGRATKPGDIVTTLSGQTVEIQNTDAEGRLILADGLAYATRYKPAAIIDVATLTGACVVALGQFAIGMLGNDDGIKRRLAASGQKTGERVWEMPLWDEYFEQLRSDVADMRNIGGRGGGMITAALFLSKFVGKHPWVHLDIASTDWSERERAYIPKGPTGIGTRLLIQYLIEEARGA